VKLQASKIREVEKDENIRLMMERLLKFEESQKQSENERRWEARRNTKTNFH